MREMTMKGDPMLNVNLPVDLEQTLLKAAKENKRRLQDEVLNRLFHSFKREIFCHGRELNKTELVKRRQQISREMLDILKKCALARGVSLDAEVSHRLSSSFIEIKKLDVEELLNQRFSSHTQRTENQQNRKAWKYLLQHFPQSGNQVVRHL